MLILTFKYDELIGSGGSQQAIPDLLWPNQACSLQTGITNYIHGADITGTKTSAVIFEGSWRVNTRFRAYSSTACWHFGPDGNYVCWKYFCFICSTMSRGEWLNRKIMRDVESARPLPLPGIGGSGLTLYQRCSNVWNAGPALIQKWSNVCCLQDCAPIVNTAVIQCCFNVGPSSATLAQHVNNIGSTSLVFYPPTPDPLYLHATSAHHPHIDLWPTLWLLILFFFWQTMPYGTTAHPLSQKCKRRFFRFDIPRNNQMLFHCWASVADSGPTLILNWLNVCWEL